MTTVWQGCSRDPMGDRLFCHSEDKASYTISLSVAQDARLVSCACHSLKDVRWVIVENLEATTGYPLWTL